MASEDGEIHAVLSDIQDASGKLNNAIRHVLGFFKIFRENMLKIEQSAKKALSQESPTPTSTLCITTINLIVKERSRIEKYEKQLLIKKHISFIEAMYEASAQIVHLLEGLVKDFQNESNYKDAQSIANLMESTKWVTSHARELMYAGMAKLKVTMNFEDKALGLDSKLLQMLPD